MDARKKLVFTACYNEVDNVGPFCAAVLALPQGYDLLVVDDNSPDGTGPRLDELAADEPRLTVIHRPRKLGLGTAHKLAMQYALRHGYQVLVTLDADLSHDPADIPRLDAALDDADFVIGSRYIQGGGSTYGGYRYIVSVMGNKASRWLLRLPLYETTTSFRAFRVSLFRLLNFQKIEVDGYGFFVQSIFFIVRAGFRCTEIPITFKDRIEGVSKIPRWEIISAMINLLRLFLKQISGRHEEPCGSEQLPACYHCGYPYLVKKHLPTHQPAPTAASRVQCTTMSHRAKPLVAHCLVCGLDFAPDGVANEQVDAAYADVVDVDYVRNRDVRMRTFERLFERLPTLTPEHGEIGRMLEIGAYCGYFGKIAERFGLQYIGVEPSSWAANYARDSMGLDVLTGTLEENLDRVGGPFEAVVMWDVLEHLRDPQRTLNEAAKLLAPNGVLCLTTLDANTWFPKLLGRRWPWIMEMHLFYFREETLTSMLERAGLRIERAEPYTHYIALRYLWSKLGALLPLSLGWLLAPLRIVTPGKLIIPVALGDVKLYVCRRIEAGETSDAPSG